MARQSEQDSRGRPAGEEQPGKNSRGRTAGVEQPGQDSGGRSAGTGQPGQVSPDRSARKINQDWSLWTGQRGEDGQIRQQGHDN